MLRLMWGRDRSVAGRVESILKPIRETGRDVGEAGYVGCIGKKEDDHRTQRSERILITGRLVLRKALR